MTVPRVLVTRNKKHPERPLLRAVHRALGDPRDRRPHAQGVSDAQLLGLDLQARPADRPAVPARRHRQMRGAVRRSGDSRGAQVDRARLRLASWAATTRATSPTITQAHEGRRPRPGLRVGGALPRPDRGAARPRSPRTPSCSTTASTPTCSASPTTSSPPQCSSSSCVAAASAVCAAGSSTRSSIVELPELVESVLQNAYDDARCRRVTSSCPRCPTTRQPSSAGSARCVAAGGRVELARRAARRQGRARSDGRAQREERAHALQDPPQRRLRRALAGARRHPGGARAWTEAPLRMECYDVSHLSGTNIVASMVVFEDGLPRKDQYRRFSIPESTDDTESIYQVLTRRLAYLQDRARAGSERRRSDGADADAQEVRVPAAAAHRRRRAASGRGRAAGARRGGSHGHPTVRHREAARGDLAARLRLPGDPAAQQRRALPLPAHPR